MIRVKIEIIIISTYRHNVIINTKSIEANINLLRKCCIVLTAIKSFILWYVTKP